MRKFHTSEYNSFSFLLVNKLLLNTDHILHFLLKIEDGRGMEIVYKRGEFDISVHLSSSLLVLLLCFKSPSFISPSGLIFVFFFTGSDDFRKF